MQGQIALVTGAAKGLGRAFSRIFLKKGAKVCLADINADVGAKTVEKFKTEFGNENVTFQKCDVTSQTDMEAAFQSTQERLGSPNILINNAGMMHEGNWRDMLNVNLTSVIQGTLLGIEVMGKHRRGDGGVIVNVSSAAGVLPMPFGPVYTASKFGVVGFTRCFKTHALRKEYGVRVNCLCPAFAKTDILKISEEEGHLVGEKMAQRMLQATGLMEPEVVANAMLPLVENEELNGDVLLVTRLGTKIINYPERTLQDWYD